MFTDKVARQRLDEMLEAKQGLERRVSALEVKLVDCHDTVASYALYLKGLHVEMYRAEPECLHLGIGSWARLCRESSPPMDVEKIGGCILGMNVRVSAELTGDHISVGKPEERAANPLLDIYAAAAKAQAGIMERQAVITYRDRVNSLQTTINLLMAELGKEEVEEAAIPARRVIRDIRKVGKK